MKQLLYTLLRVVENRGLLLTKERKSRMFEKIEPRSMFSPKRTDLSEE
jgi:hypothetical protein